MQVKLHIQLLEVNHLKSDLTVLVVFESDNIRNQLSNNYQAQCATWLFKGILSTVRLFNPLPQWGKYMIIASQLFFVLQIYKSSKSLSPQNSHVHLIDALMMAYTAGMISTEKVVSSVKRFSNITASKELPYDLEDAMILWINKVLTRQICSGFGFFSHFQLTVFIIFFTLGQHEDEGADRKRE